MAKGIRCLDKRYLSTIVRDLHLESHEQYREFHRRGVFHGWLPSNLYNYIKVKGIFGNNDYVSLDTLVNIWSHLRSEKLLHDFQRRYPEFLPSNWESYYGVTPEDLDGVIDLYPEIDMCRLIEIIHPTNVEVSEVDKKYYKDADKEKFFREDLATYKKVVESALESLESHGKNFSIESILGPNEKWKRDSIKNYLILDGIAIDSDPEAEIIASIDEVRFVMGMLNGGTHPIYSGLEGYFTFDKHEDRLAEHHRVMSAASDFNVNHGDKVKDEFNDEFFNEIAMELEKENEPINVNEPSNEMDEVENTSPNEWEVHLDGLVILLPRSSNKKIMIDGNKIIIQ